MVVEAILIVGLAAFVIVRTKQQSAKISELENELRIQKSRTDVLEAVVQEILRGQHSTVKQRVAQVVQNVRPSNNQRPVQVQARPVQQEMQQAPPPPPPRANPLESMMAMMAPMMSSLVIGGDDDGPETNVEINEEPEVDDSEIAEELGDLKEGIEVEEVVSEGDEVTEEVTEEATEEVTEDSTSSNAENVGEQIDNEIEDEIAALAEDEEDK